MGAFLAGVLKWILSNPWRAIAIGLGIALAAATFFHWAEVSYLKASVERKDSRIATLEGELKSLADTNARFKADLAFQKEALDAFTAQAEKAIKESNELLALVREDNKKLRQGTEQLVSLIKLSKDECVGIFDVLDEIIKRRQG